MSTLGDVLFSLYHTWQDVPRRDIQDLAAFVFGKTRDELFLSLEEASDTISEDKLKELVAKRSAHYPFAYLVGKVHFCNCSIAVNSHVLIPRHETELLLHKVMQKIQKRQVQVAYDLCTGSGCLGIALKKHYPSADVYLADISPYALEIAQSNAKKNQVSITALLGDLMEPFCCASKADVVLCNPPYIAENEFADLEPSVREFEPKQALVSGSSGLEIFARLATELPPHINPGGLLALEIGHLQAEEVSKIFSKHPWKILSIEKDYAQLDRFIFLEIE